MENVRVRSLAEAEQHVVSLTIRVEELERLVSDHAQRFDTLQTALWKRVWFRVDGWPGMKNLNAERRAWRPWHRRRGQVGIIVLALFAAFLPTARAAGPQPLELALSWEQSDTYIELQSIPFGFPTTGQASWVHRSPETQDCFWDSDDHARYLAYKTTLDGTYTLSRCVIADDPAYPNYAFFYGLSVESASANLVVSITSVTPTATYVHTLPAVKEGSSYIYRGCLGGPLYLYPDSVVAFPDTNGGTGVPTEVVFTVANPDRRTARILRAGALISQGDYYFQATSGGFRSNGGYVYYCRHDNPMSVARPLEADPAFYHD